MEIVDSERPVISSKIKRFERFGLYSLDLELAGRQRDVCVDGDHTCSGQLRTGWPKRDDAIEYICVKHAFERADATA